MTGDLATIEPVGRARRKRKATEESIISAFETVLEREGVRTIGVNSVVKEAGVGKGLIYKYFGGLPGLVHAWAQSRKIWPNFKDLIREVQQDDADQLKPIKTILLSHANELRQRPLALEVLAEELSSPSVISEAFTQARSEFCNDHSETLSSLRGFQSQANRDLGLILFAAANYLAMRSRSAPSYMGLQLDTDEGWEAVIAAMGKIIDRAGESGMEGPEPEPESSPEQHRRQL